MASYPTEFSSKPQPFQEQQNDNQADGSTPVMGLPPQYYGSVNAAIVVADQPHPCSSEVHNGDQVQMVEIWPPVCSVLGAFATRINA